MQGAKCALEKLSQEAEEYIEAIYKLQKSRGVAKTLELAEELQVVPGSITNTLSHLERHGLVERKPYRGVKLTKKGEKIAINVIRKHRLAERLLTDILEVEWSNVHETACRLEHALTEELLPLLEKRLGYPKFCPHGNPIPTDKGEVRDVECQPLTNFEPNQLCLVVRMTDEKKEKLFTLAQKGIKPNITVHVVRKTQANLILCIAGVEQKLSRREAASVWVKAMGEEDYV